MTDDHFREQVLETLPAAAPWNPGFGMQAKEFVYIPAAVSDEWEYVVEEALKPHLPAIESSGEASSTAPSE